MLLARFDSQHFRKASQATTLHTRTSLTTHWATTRIFSFTSVSIFSIGTVLALGEHIAITTLTAIAIRAREAIVVETYNIYCCNTNWFSELHSTNLTKHKQNTHTYLCVCVCVNGNWHTDFWQRECICFKR